MSGRAEGGNVERVHSRLAPRFLDRSHRFLGKLARQRPVFLRAQPFLAALDRIQQCARRLRNRFNRIAGLSQVVQHGDDTRRHVEADRVAGAAGGAGIVGHQDGDAAFFTRRLLQADHRGDARCHLFDAVRLRPVEEAAEGQRVVGRALALEADGAGKDAAVELGQHDMHGEVGRREAALAVRPGVAPGRCDERLEHGNADAVEQCLAARLGAAGEGRRGHDRRWRQRCRRLLDEGDDGRVFQARDEDRHGSHAMAVQRGASASIGATSAASSIER